MTGSTDTSPRPGGLVTGAADAAVTMWLPGVGGKSTIINLIAGIDRSTVGTVTVSGRQLDPMTEEQLADRRGRLRGDRNRPRPCGNRQRGALHPGRTSRADRRRPHLRRDQEILRGYVTPFRLEQG
jgi:ABC-type cobalamin/Fe3+-siderophores transport system ATPase subunit